LFAVAGLKYVKGRAARDFTLAAALDGCGCAAADRTSRRLFIRADNVGRLLFGYMPGRYRDSNNQLLQFFGQGAGRASRSVNADAGYRFAGSRIESDNAEHGGEPFGGPVCLPRRNPSRPSIAPLFATNLIAIEVAG
jgi:hypothetical protein